MRKRQENDNKRNFLHNIDFIRLLWYDISEGRCYFMLNERLRRIRTEHKLTQQNIADVLGIDRTTYTVYETGVTTPSPATLVKLSQIYNVSVGYLIGVEDNHPELKRETGADFSRENLLNGDPISLLSKSERELLMYFRVLHDEKKQKVLEEIKKLAQNEQGI